MGGSDSGPAAALYTSPAVEQLICKLVSHFVSLNKGEWKVPVKVVTNIDQLPPHQRAGNHARQNHEAK